ncbi:26S proteasome non-ATPase regulatory subunit 1-like [Symsagittifera roscoffensis]|uniref:26S proteasome non-ATPase regulatory subunit 1-like n=1 Tax=Symsagittifera roscoffensis TaxID=84072 RepID=UPI00307B355B
MRLSSAEGIISLLDDHEADVRVFALKRLDDLSNIFWVEIADSIEKIERIYDDESFPERQLAALVASKVFYNIEAYEEAVSYALAAGKLFDIESSSLYVETIISKCIDEYVAIQSHNLTVKEPSERRSIDSRLEHIVHRMFEKCTQNEQYKQLIGMSLESRRLDVFSRTVREVRQKQQLNKIPSGVTSLDLLSYAMSICLKFMHNRQWRDMVMREVVELYREELVPDYIQMAQCLIFLNDSGAVAGMLDTLLNTNEELSYQIAFDVYENATQHFVTSVSRILSGESATSEEHARGGAGGTSTLPPAGGTTPYSDVTLMESGNTSAMEQTGSETPMDTSVSQASTVVDTPVTTTEEVTPTSDSAAAAPPGESSPTASTAEITKSAGPPSNPRERLQFILSGEATIEAHLQFLMRQNKTDLVQLKAVKEATRNSIQHNATVIANGFMHCGTTTDAFLRDNLDWLARATNWAKLTATATLGVIHKGHEKDALDLLSVYLPKGSSTGTSSGYMEGGGLYALGLIHAGHGKAIIEYLMTQVKDAVNEPVRHGGCLGLGLAALGSGRYDVYDLLKQNLFLDDANVGEAAGIAMGLVMLGSADPQVFIDMTSYAHETQHEKIVRGLCVGIALLMYRALEEADDYIEMLSNDKDALLRRSAAYVTAMAYCGTEHNKSLKRLLRVAVTDVNDDVRRASVEAIGFLLLRSPEQCPNVVKLLAESYNMHVRYGAAMALGIACAGTGNRDALNILEPLIKDSQSLVRQGAMIASAMVLIQHTQVKVAKVKEIKDLFFNTVNDKHEDTMTKFGAILAIGIVNAGGRNCTISLQSRSGHISLQSVVGMLCFLQFWYWFPCANFLSLCFSPTCVIALNNQLKMPKMQIKSNAPPSHYAYPPAMESNTKKEQEKVETAVLSITAKAKAREKQKQKDSGEKMDVDETKETPSEGVEKMESESAAPSSSDSKREIKMSTKEDSKTPAKDKEEKADKVASPTTSTTKEVVATPAAEKKRETEPSFELLDNPARVMPQQRKVVCLPEGCGYTSVKPVSLGGIVIVSKVDKESEEELVPPVPLGGSKKQEDDEPEPEAPEEFEWTED